MWSTQRDKDFAAGLIPSVIVLTAFNINITVDIHLAPS